VTAGRTAEIAERVRAVETGFAARQRQRRTAAAERMARLAPPAPRRSRRAVTPRPVDDDDEATVLRDDPW
jgi:hypothetical protein